MGRTARGVTGAGRALLFLIPEELPFLKYLKAARVPLNEYEFPQHKLANVQSQLEKLARPRRRGPPRPAASLAPTRPARVLARRPFARACAARR